MSKNDRNLDKRQQKQRKADVEARKQKRLPWIFGAIVVLIALVVGGSFLSDSFDNTKTTTTNLYSKEISLQSLHDKNAAKDDFYAYYYQPSCEHCKVVSPYLIPMAEQMSKPLFPVNIEGKHDAWTEYKVQGTPTLIHFKDGKEVERIDGQRDPSVYSEFFTNAK
ncbi:thioredoxin family protein [Tumebacillus permanentifrigoris]|uniref:Thioredoxin n=1 Tax=Tumebacillus permanentifrigoris TaxID=378543 RepID=A0A316DTM9_9BACL|nr:thioredoxin family protein [Tumebacillus permanentifrigoris]PWK11241.1 thioredoxin [Tumebacillus permanentifrigoris]